jgi:hypothetical protein
VTIKLFDIEAQKQFRDEQETYNLRVKSRMENPSDTPWPEYPKAPEPMIDSKDKGVLPMNGSAPCEISSGGMKDPNWFNPLDLDGNSHSEVDGFSTGWQDNHDSGTGHKHNTSAPFKVTKE